MLKILNTTLVAFFVASIFVHFGFYFGVNLVERPERKQSDEKPLEFVILDPATDATKIQQIVEQDKNQLNEEEPDKARFLGRHNQKVIKETRAANTGDFSNAAQPGQRVSGSPEEPQNKPSPHKLTGDLPTLDKLKPNFSLTPKAEEQVVQKAGENSQTSDHLKDVEKGLQTLLSTREFVYYAYYQRIREKIRAQWEPKIKEKVRKVFASGRSIASSRDRITQVVIILDNKGALINVKIIGQSGLKDLDDAAIEAFRAAEPFPNPPNGIVEADGTIKIRWDFVLEANYIPAPKKKFAQRDDQP